MLLRDGPPDALRRERQLPDLHAGGLMNGRADRGGNAQDPSFAGPLRPIWTRTVFVLDQNGVQLAGHVHRGRDPVVQRAEIPDPAALVEDQLLHQRVAEPHHRRSFVLRFDLLRVERLADVARQNEARHVDGTGFRVDLDFHGRAHELPELRSSTQRMVGAESAAAILADADELPSRRTEPVPEHLRVGELPFRQPEPRRARR